jgi:putative holliday junction resolvase
MSRIMAVDFGERRIGIAMSDPTRTIASPLTALGRRPGKRPPWVELKRLMQEHEVAELVVGLPLALSGEDSAWTKEVREFASQLATRTALPVHLIDERMTSVQAERAVRGMGLRRSQREQKERVDAAAAAIILRCFLERQGNDRNDSAG